jgi:serine protease Do
MQMVAPTRRLDLGSAAGSMYGMRLTVALLMAASGAWPQQPAGAPPKPQPAAPQASPALKQLDALHGLSSELERLSRRVSRSVVQIFSTGYKLSNESEAGTDTAVVTRERASGSGVILSADGYIVTNSHVVAGARYVRVRLAQEMAGKTRMQPMGKLLEARIVGVDRETDLAVIKVEKTGLSSLTLGDSDGLRQGELVMAFGNPLGLENSVSLGIVSSVGRQIKPDDTMIYIQTDAPINPGNSGGPLVDSDGHIMGLNTFILSQSGGSEGLGFAIPSNIIKSVYTQIRKEGHVHRTEIGIVAQTITLPLATGLHLGQDWGVVLGDVTPDGPADKAGLKVGDLILSVNGRPMQDSRQLAVTLYRYKQGDKVEVEVLRGSSHLTFPVEVVNRDDDPQRFADLVDPEKDTVAKLGILGVAIDRKLAPLVPELRNQYGIVVAANAGQSAYSGDSLQLGDVIYSVNTVPVTSVDALRKAIDDLQVSDPLVLQIEREGSLRYLTMTME